MADVARVVTPDLRGFGDSPLGDDEPSLDHAADDVAAAARPARPRPGGPRRPVDGRVRRDGLPAPAPRPGARPGAGRHQGGRRPGRPPGTTGCAIAARLDAGRQPRPSCVEDVLPGLTGPTTAAERPEVVARVRAMVESAPPRRRPPGRSARWRPVRTRSTCCGASTCRRWSCVATRTGWPARPTSRRWPTRCPRAGSRCCRGAGHLSALEVPDEVVRAVRGLLARVDAGGLTGR